MLTFGPQVLEALAQGLLAPSEAAAVISQLLRQYGSRETARILDAIWNDLGPEAVRQDVERLVSDDILPYEDERVRDVQESLVGTLLETGDGLIGGRDPRLDDGGASLIRLRRSG